MCTPHKNPLSFQICRVGTEIFATPFDKPPIPNRPSSFTKAAFSRSMREEKTMTGPGSSLLKCLVISSMLSSVLLVSGHSNNETYLRNKSRALKKMKMKSMKKVMGKGYYKGYYEPTDGAMKYRPPSMNTQWGYHDIFKMSSHKGKGYKMKVAKMMGTNLWMYKGKGTGIPSKSSDTSFFGKGQGNVPAKGQGKGQAASSMGMGMSGMGMGMDSGRYYPPRPPFYPDCNRVCSSACMSVTSVFLVDSTNDVRLFPIQQGEFLDFDFLEAFYGVTEFSVECVANGNVGSMTMTDNFGTNVIDNDPPFILAGDDRGNFFDSNFRQNPGTWRVTCQPFCGDNAMGPGGPAETISFVVGPGGPGPGPGCDTCGPGCLEVVDFVLVDARTNTRLRSIVPGETIEVGPDDSYTIECMTNPDSSTITPFPVGSAVLTDNYENIEPNLENTPPFALNDDNAGNYNPSAFFQNPGPWEVSCTAYCGLDATGYASPTNTIGFTVEAVISATPRPPTPTPPVPTPTPPVPTPTPPVPTPPVPTPTPPVPTPPVPTPPVPTPPVPTPPVPTPPVPTPPSPATESPVLDCSTCRSGCIFADYFNLVNADTDTVIRPMVEGETLQVSETDSFALECITTPAPFSATPFQVGSTFLTDNHEETGNSENSPPYALADDNSGDFRPSPLYQYPGEWIVTCQAFCGRSQRGDSSNLLTLRFFVERV